MEVATYSINTIAMPWNIQGKNEYFPKGVFMKWSIFFRRTSVCSAISCAFFLLAGLVTSVSAAQIFSSSYDMRNGDLSSPGTSLMDDTYAGAGATGNRTVPYSPLAGGLGDLTNGLIAPGNWDAYPLFFVGWRDYYVPNPTITFYFGSTVNIDEVKINMNKGYNPSSVTFTMGSTSTNGSVSNDISGGANAWYDFLNLGLTGNTLVVTLNDRQAEFIGPNYLARDWILISEVEFYGSNVPAVPEPATMLLLGSGLIGLAGYGRKKFFKK